MNIIIDYKAGNLFNLKNSLNHLGIPNEISGDPKKIESADKLLFPGVGAFAPAMDNLNKSGLLTSIKNKVNGGTPFLGICVGMQLLFTKGYENGVHDGLNFIEGDVKIFEHDLKIPQIGWNQLMVTKDDPLFKGIDDKSYFYFVHSYHGVLKEPSHLIGQSDYGHNFTAAVRKNNIWGVQFHPEKSQDNGLQLLKNFCEF